MAGNSQMARQWAWIAGATLLSLLWIPLKTTGLGEHSPGAAALLGGLSIIGAAFLLSWAAEVAELDIPRSLALAFLALMAVLPEYAVDIYLAWTAGKNPVYTHYALANMIGANRLLIGGGWAFVVFLYWLKTRKTEVVIGESHRVEFSFLCWATIYSFLIPLKKSLSVFDGVFLLLLFFFYIYKAMKSHVEEPELEGPAEAIALLPRWPRRVVNLLLFLLAGGAIYLCAEPFSEGLIESGKRFGIESFLLIQWLAPLASEFPEFLVAALFAMKGSPGKGMGALISSKVNQWTLLVGMVPIVFAVSAGRFVALAFDPRQVEEFLLTAAQSLFAVSVLANFRINVREAFLLFFLFAMQLILQIPEVLHFLIRHFPALRDSLVGSRYLFSAIYLALALVILLQNYVWGRKSVKASL